MKKNDLKYLVDIFRDSEKDYHIFLAFFSFSVIMFHLFFPRLHLLSAFFCFFPFLLGKAVVYFKWILFCNIFWARGSRDGRAFYS